MQKIAHEPGTKLNLSGVCVLLVEGVTTEMDILTQIFSGLGAKTLHRAETAARAKQLAQSEPIDLVLVDAVLPDGDGFDVVRSLRGSGHETTRFAPVLLFTGHTQQRRIAMARDCGANFVVAKPITPQVLFERIAWMSRDTRKFIEAETYVGPDRRFKMLGPPAGMKGRRETDLSFEVGDATEPNLDQSDIDALFSPQKASL